MPRTHTHNWGSSTSSTTIIKYADDTVVMITNNKKQAYHEEILHLGTWCQTHNFIRQKLWTASDTLGCTLQKTLYWHDISTVCWRRDNISIISGAWRTSDYLPKYCWTATCIIESIVTSNIATWFGNSSMKDRCSLQRIACIQSSPTYRPATTNSAVLYPER